MQTVPRTATAARCAVIPFTYEVLSSRTFEDGSGRVGFEYAVRGSSVLDAPGSPHHSRPVTIEQRGRALIDRVDVRGTVTVTLHVDSRTLVLRGRVRGVARCEHDFCAVDANVRAAGDGARFEARQQGLVDGASGFVNVATGTALISERDWLIDA
jgi:hypothetical protein